jgi:hypothetical protein
MVPWRGKGKSPKNNQKEMHPMKIIIRLMLLFFVLIAPAAQNASAGQSLFDLIKQVEEVKLGLDTVDDTQNATDSMGVTDILGSMACGSTARSATSVIKAGAFIACSKAIEALSAQLTKSELAEVQASTEESLTTGEDSTWSNDAGVKVENKVVREETRTETVPLAIGFVQAGVSAMKRVIIYASPSKDSDLLAFVEPGDELFVVGRLQSVDWYVVENDDSTTGFVQAVSIQDEVSRQSAVSEFIARELAVIYKSPSKDSKLLAAVEEGDQVLIVGQKSSGEWYSVKSSGKRPAGYIQAASLTKLAASPQPGGQQETATAPTSSLTLAARVQGSTTVASTDNASEQQAERKEYLPTAVKPAEDQQAAPVAVAQTQNVGLSMSCRTVERKATLSGGEVIVEEVTACKTPDGWVRV